jgi:hypothetical protein
MIENRIKAIFTLIALLFIVLGIGLLLFNIQETLENKGVNVNVGTFLKDRDGISVTDSTGNLITVKKLNNKGVVVETSPNIKLDADGFALQGPDGKVILNTNTNIFNKSGPQYSSDVNKVYHEDPSKKVVDDSSTGISVNGNVDLMKDATGKVVPLGSLLDGVYVQKGNNTANNYIQNNPLYVPDYEDSVYLSRTATFPYIDSIKYNKVSASGICNKYGNDIKKLERACNNLDKNICAATSCCVLIGGSKCASGNEFGPFNINNYNDQLFVNRDYYYYNGNCYGNCY